ncbi:MAG: lactate racemase domain-containing protein [Veillonellales bacterium]
MNSIDQLLSSTPIPKVIKVRQHFSRPVVKDIAGAIRNKLMISQVLKRIQPGHRIAITVGSRGIANMQLIVRTIVEIIKEAGAIPFLVPAMGSHGGATSEGQRDLLTSRGFTEEYVKAPIYSNITPIKIGMSKNGLPVYFDSNAYQADWTIVVNRVKPHTSFHGRVESGIQKMIVIGLGKQKGADFCHNQGFDAMAENIPAIAEVALKKANILCGIAILENPYHETAQIEVLPTDIILKREPELLIEAKKLCPQLYIKSFDVMIVDEIGKNISGTGFDTNILGRFLSEKIVGVPNFKRMAILDITKESHGGANGLGLSDYTTERVFHKFDFEQTYANSLTTTVTSTAKIPIVLKNDKQAIQACIKCSNRADKENITMVRIKNTISVEEIEISENLKSYAMEHPQLEVLSEPYTWCFNEDGNFNF